MDEKDVYWLAGLLEGEGSFLRAAPSEPNCPRVKVKMTDKDVIQRVAGLFGVNYVQTRKGQRAKHWKVSYDVQVKGKPAIRIMKQLHSLMGERRQRQIEVAIDHQIAMEYTLHDEYMLYWLAGILEGEGSFLKGPPTESNRVRIQVQMSDRDIIGRAAALLETTGRGPYRPTNDRPYYRSYYIAVKRGAKAGEMMRQLRPLMGQRRQAQIDAALASYIPDRDHGDNHPQAKLTAEKVREIKRRLAEGEKLTRLAREYEVDKGLIWQIKAGRIWQHVT